MKSLRSGWWLKVLAAAVVLMGTATASRSDEISLSDIPVILARGVAPNFLLTLDDSESMKKKHILKYSSEKAYGINPRFLREKPADMMLVDYIDSLTPEAVLGRLVGALNRGRVLEDRQLTLAHLDFAGRSSHQNALAYDPAVSYLPPRGPDGDLFPNAPFESAWEDGFSAWLRSEGVPGIPEPQTVNLASQFEMQIFDSISDTPDPKAAWYTVYHPNPDYDPATPLVSGEVVCDNDVYTRACYTEEAVTGAQEQQNFANWYSYYRTRMLTTKTSIAFAFAELDTSTRLGYQTINQISATTMLNGASEVQQHDSNAVHEVQAFSGTKRRDFYHWLAGTQAIPLAKTPLITGVVNAGEYFSTADPYREKPGEPDPDNAGNSNPERSCRQNFQLLFTDGAWEDDDSRVVIHDGNGPINVDADEPDLSWDIPLDLAALGEGPNIFADIDEFDATSPFRDVHSGYVADHTFHYWVTDLRPDDADAGDWDDVPQSLPNRPSKPDAELTDDELDDMFYDPANDPAIWQHMVTYTIGFGVYGSLDPTDWLGLKAGTTPWPVNKIDDLWHAAINSRGKFFDVKTPDDLIRAMQSVVNDVASAAGSAAALSANSGALFSQSLLFQAKYDTVGWLGDLIALQLAVGDGSDGCVKPNDENMPAGDVCRVRWQAALKLDGREDPADTRQIITFKPGTGGTQFEWDAGYLSAKQMACLHDPPDCVGAGDGSGEKRLDYLRGDDSNEQDNSGSFRNRSGRLLGDIVNSAPVFVGAPRGTFTEESYATFRDTYKDRTPVVYVGASDGMLHAFHAGTGTNGDGDTVFSDLGGKELFGYVPNAVYPNLAWLTDPGYDSNHKFYVDGPLNSGDAEISAGTWKTVLLGALGKGGQAVFALDVTSPAGFSQSDASSMVLWEFDDRAEAVLGKAADAANYSADLGYTYGKPAIARIPKVGGTKWVAVFGNGYNNTANDDSDGDGINGDACIDASDPEPCTISRTGNAALYLVDLKPLSTFSAADVVKLGIPVGNSEDPGGASRDNGISSVTVVDEDSDLVADVIYAGDLFGNVWKILLKEAGPEIAFDSKPLFSARDATRSGAFPNGYPQPITSKIRVIRHSRGIGLLLLFGTGKYLGPGDIGDDSVQTFYAIWDDGSRSGYPEDGATAITRDDLQQQTILDEEEFSVDVDGVTTEIHYRVTSDHRIAWREPSATAGEVGWYLDLVSPAEDGGAQGERVFQEPQVRNNRIVFTSVIPRANANPCRLGGDTGWVNILDARDGSRLAAPPVDTNLNGSLGSTDLVTYNDTDVTLSSIRVGADDVVYSVPSTVVSGSDLIDYLADSTGKNPVKLLESSGLAGRAWSEIR